MLPMDFSRVVDSFATPLPVEVYDVTGGYESGEWTWNEPVLRIKRLSAVVLQLSIEQLQLYQQGNIADGGIALLTSERMHISGSMRDDESEDFTWDDEMRCFDRAAWGLSVIALTRSKQSYVTYQGRRWRVVGDGFLSGPGGIGNTTTHCWHCLRWFA